MAEPAARHFENGGGAICWLASFPKSGNTWTRILLSNLLAADTIGENDFVSLDGLFSSNRPLFDSITGLSSSDMTDEEIDLLRPDYYRRQTAATNRQLFVKVHEGYYRNADGEPILPADCSNGAIYLVRHPYDVAVSYAHHQGHDNFDLIIDQMNAADHALSSLGGMQLRQRTLGWQGHFRSWQDQEAIPVITIRYEDMLFVYETPQPVAFWMENTLIPLDMLFFDASGKLERVHENARPLDRTPIPGGNDIRFVLEINGGLATELGIEPGAELRHPSIDQAEAAWPCDDG
jgi:uncharacterized membrane protein (UPF0127 family)